MKDSKRCNKCKIWQSKTDFHRDKGKPNGRNTICKRCRNKATSMGEDSANNGLKGKSLCLRSNKMIFKKDCIPGCNDACILCPNKQLDNIKAGNDTYTPEEETIMRHEGVRGMGYGDMIEMHAER